MPRPKPINYNAPADLLDRLPAPTIVTRGDELALLRQLSERAGSTVQAGTNRIILAAIEADVRAAHHRPAQKDNAPAKTGAPSKAGTRAEARSEAGSSIAQVCALYKIDMGHSGPLLVKPETGRILVAHESICTLALTPDQARQFAAALDAAAEDVDRDTAVREHNLKLLEAATG
jgi:hypothetical protein